MKTEEYEEYNCLNQRAVELGTEESRKTALIYQRHLENLYSLNIIVLLYTYLKFKTAPQYDEDETQ